MTMYHSSLNLNIFVHSFVCTRELNLSTGLVLQIYSGMYPCVKILACIDFQSETKKRGSVEFQGHHKSLCTRFSNRVRYFA